MALVSTHYKGVLTRISDRLAQRFFARRLNRSNDLISPRKMYLTTRGQRRRAAEDRKRRRKSPARAARRARMTAMGRLRPFSCGYEGIRCQVFTTRAKQCPPSRPPVLYWYPVLLAMGAGFRALSGICIFSI